MKVQEPLGERDTRTKGQVLGPGIGMAVGRADLAVVVRRQGDSASSTQPLMLVSRCRLASLLLCCLVPGLSQPTQALHPHLSLPRICKAPESPCSNPSILISGILSRYLPLVRSGTQEPSQPSRFPSILINSSTSFFWYSFSSPTTTALAQLLPSLSAPSRAFYLSPMCS